jgi:membrane-associated protease RseP (regulator of RpoE activity)
MAAREKVRIKSLGWGLLAVIPMAFVEPDEKQLQKQKSWKQLRVFAVGSFANYVIAFASLAVLAFMALSFFVPAGVGFQALAQGYPAAGVNMTGAITGINGYDVNSSRDLSQILRTIGPNQTITVTTANGTQSFTYNLETVPEPEPSFSPDFTAYALAGIEQALPGTIDFSKSASNGFAYITGSYQQPSWSSIQREIKLWEYVKSLYPDNTRADARIASLESELASHPRSGFIGILGVFDSTEIRPGLESYDGAVTFIQGLMFFLFLINFGVGLFNMLPIGPLDGGRMWDIALKRITPRHSKRIMSILTWIMLALILANFALVLL